MNSDVQNDVSIIQKRIVSEITSKIGGEYYRRLSGKDLRFIFELYDELIFGSQISQQIRKKNSQIKFKASVRCLGIVSLCGTLNANPLIYYVDIAPNILKKGCPVSLILKIIANQMIHLILLCWNLAQDHPTYFSEGLLHKKLLLKYFGPNFILEKGMVQMDLEKPIKYLAPFIDFSGLFVYRENSCYLDSLLTLLLLSEPDFYRRGMLDVDMDHIQYKNLKLLSKSPQLPSQKEIKIKVNDLQNSLLSVYFNLIERKETQTSNSVRNQLLEFYPDLKTRSGWDIYNTSAIYDLLTEIFPELKINPIPTWIKAPGKEIRRVSRKLTMFQFWDFFGETNEGEEIDWEEINTPILVFQNGGIPLLHYNSLEPEIIDGRVYYKQHCFGETILNDRYKLFGVVTLHGTLIGQEGGVHYTSYICLKGGQWCHYNDIGPSLMYFKSFPEEVFHEVNGHKPELYFYYKMPVSPLEIKMVERPGRRTVILVKDKGCSEVEKNHLLKLNPLKTKDSRTWLWVLKPYEAQKIHDRLEEISSGIKVKR